MKILKTSDKGGGKTSKKPNKISRGKGKQSLAISKRSEGEKGVWRLRPKRKKQIWATQVQDTRGKK